MATTSRRLHRLSASSAGLLVASALSACGGWAEGICNDHEVWVQHTGTGGSECREQVPSDPDCPDGEIPRDQQPAGRLDCVTNDVTAEPYRSR